MIIPPMEFQRVTISSPLNHSSSAFSAVSAVSTLLALLLRLQEGGLQVLVQGAQAGGHPFQQLQGDFLFGF
jgi:hypothetical protein